MNLADLYLAVRPDTGDFGPELDRQLAGTAKKSGDKAGRTLGAGVETGAAKISRGKFLGSPAMKRAAGAAGVGLGTTLAKMVATQMAGRITQRAGAALGDKLVNSAAAKIKSSSAISKALSNPRLMAAAAGVGLLIGAKILSGANKKLAGGQLKLPKAVGGGAGGLGGLLGGGLKVGGIAGLAGGLIGGGILAKIKEFANKASDLNEEVSKSRNVFGSSSAAIEKWSRSSNRNLGLSRLEAIRGTSAFGNLFNQLKFGQKASVGMSQGFLQMAADAGSFNNADPSQVMDAFLSATRGEYDALQRFIPTVSAATIQTEALRQTHKKSATDLTAAEKVTALYAVSMRDLGKAHGDFARTGGGFANLQRSFAANWENLQIQIGQYFLPIFERATRSMNEKGFPALTRIVRVLGEGGRAAGAMAKAVVGALSGAFGPAVDKATLNLTEMADWFSTHQAAMINFFIRLGDGAIGLGRAVTGFVAGSLRGFADFSDGLAGIVRDTGPALASILEQASQMPIFGRKMRDSFATAAVAIRSGSASAAAGLASTAGKAREAATAVETKAYPAFDKAGKALHRVGQQKIWEAAQRDAAARATIAIRNIGNQGDVTRNKLRGYNIESGRGSAAQLTFASRVYHAAVRLEEQRLAGVRGGATQKQLTDRWNAGREALRREFIQMGYSKAEAQRLTDKYAKIPKHIQVKHTTPGGQQAIDKAKDLDRKINDLNNKNVSIKFGSNADEIAKKYGIIIRGSPESAARRTRGDARGGIIPHGLERGGVLPGNTPLSRGDDIAFPMASGGIQPLRGGEGIAVTEVMRDPYERAQLLAKNKAALRGESMAQFRRGMATGGTVSRTVSARSGPFAGGGAPGTYDQVSSRIAGQIGTSLARALQQKIQAASSAGGGPVGSGGYATGLAWARRQAGKPYRYPMVGPNSYDCSGFISALHNVINGSKHPYSRRYSTGSFKGGPAHGGGLTRNKVSPLRVGIIPTGENGGKIGHMAGTLNGVNVESAGGVGVRIGGRARGWNNRLFKYHYGRAGGGLVGDPAFDLLDPRGDRFIPWLGAALAGRGPGMATGGTVLRSGWAKVGERGPETIYANKGDTVSPGGPTHVHIYLDGQEVFSNLIEENEAYHAALARARR